MKMMQHLPHTGKDPEIVAFKLNQTADAPFDFTDMDIVMRANNLGVPAEEENKNEGEQAAVDADAQMAA